MQQQSTPRTSGGGFANISKVVRRVTGINLTDKLTVLPYRRVRLTCINVALLYFPLTIAFSKQCHPQLPRIRKRAPRVWAYETYVVRLEHNAPAPVARRICC